MIFDSKQKNKSKCWKHRFWYNTVVVGGMGMCRWFIISLVLSWFMVTSGSKKKKWRIAYEHANCKTYLGQQEVQKTSFALFSLGLSSFFSRESVLASSMLQEIRLFSSMLSVFSVTFEDVVAGPLTLLICCIQCQVRLLPAWTCTRPPVRYNPKKCILYTKWMHPEGFWRNTKGMWSIALHSLSDFR